MDYLSAQKNYNMLSLPDLLEARDLYHGFLTSKPHVVATAVGRYLIRKSDPPPPIREGESPESLPARHKEPRTLGNSEVRRYSWPCILVFVDKWISPDDFKQGKAEPENIIPKALQLPSGGQVPVCTVLAEPMPSSPTATGPINFSHRFYGGGYPLLAEVQGQEHVASVGCLVTDAHTIYALTNRHVTGPAGTPVYSIVGGQRVEIGRSSSLQLSRLPFEKVWGPLVGKEVYVNLDIGLVAINDLNCWTAQVYGIGQIGSLADVSSGNLSLRLIGCPVRAHGAASGLLEGVIHGLFYRYKAVRGFEYVADFLIGPRDEGPFFTQHGDSGTIWLMETDDPHDKYRPIAVQWGGVTFAGRRGGVGQALALATSLSSVCGMLNVDMVRDLNTGLPEFWGSVGHYTIAALACDRVAIPNLKQLMLANRDRISYQTTDIETELPSPDWSDPFVPLADVADVIWKGQSFSPHPWVHDAEHPNHFADMDKPQPGSGPSLLELCEEDSANVSVSVWEQYYQAVNDESQGLLPFRVWQIYDDMVKALQDKNRTKFVGAAGVLAHYVGDACQPLHISYMFNGDPDRSGTGGHIYGYGVHSEYETKMVNRHIFDIMDGLGTILPSMVAPPRVDSGREAAIATVNLMQQTFDTIKPVDIVNKYAELKAMYYHQHDAPNKVLDGLWDEFGEKTKEVMARGCLLLAVLWESAWDAGEGDQNIHNLHGVSRTALKNLYKSPTFLPSYTLVDIDSHLSP